MPKLIFNYKSEYKSEDLFNLVADIESYPEFIPWVIGARIKKKEKNILLAELLIKYKIFRASYISKIILVPKEKIIVELAEGPFKYLVNEWHFEKNIINFMLDFELKSSFLNDLIAEELGKYSERIMQCFAQRAEKKLNKSE